MSRITTTVVTLLLTTAAFGQAKDDAGDGKKLDKQTMEIKDYLPEIHGTIRGKYEYQTETGESRFEVRNARFSVSGNVHPLVAYKAEIDLSDEGSIKMLDAYARVFPVKDLNFTIGQMRVPFTIDAHRSPHQQYFANRSFIAKQVGNVRDVGLTSAYTHKGDFPFILEGGLFNGSGLTNQKEWHKTLNYSIKAQLLPGKNWNVTLSTQMIKPEDVRINMYDAGIYYQNNRFHIEAEYLYKMYGHNAFKDVHAVNVTDNQSSVMRLGSLAMCKVLKDAGMNPIFQLACRDRNRIALESDLLSAAMFGIDNILCLTGDHTKMGDHPQAKPVFDLDSVSLLHTVKLLESGVDLGGNQLVGEPPKFSKGAVVSPCSDSVDAQLAKMERKVAAGADYFQTQAVFEPEKFIKFMEKAKQFGKPVQVGIIIPKSAGMAKFMNNNVAGIHVPDEMIEELKADKEKTKAGITGVEIAARIIKECKPYCQGVHIMALGWESKIPDLLKLAEI